MDGEDDLRAHLEISKEYLEAAHGRALRYGSPREAEAYYRAINRIDDALDQTWNLDAQDVISDTHMGELIAESRAARKKGPRRATKHEERMQELREKYKPRQPLLEKARAFIRGGGGT